MPTWLVSCRSRDNRGVAIAVVLLLYLAHVIYAIAVNRFLFADGVHFFVSILRWKAFCYGGRPYGRSFADALTQYPLLATIKAGVTNLSILSRVYGTGLFAPYLVCVSVWVWVTRGQREYLLFLLVFLFAAAMNCEFFIISESHAAAALYFALAGLMLLRIPWHPAVAAVAAFLAAFTLRSYESMVFFGPILALLSLWRAGKCRALYARLGWVAFACWFVAGAFIALHGIIHPAAAATNYLSVWNDGIHLIGANVLAAFTGATHLHYEVIASAAGMLLIALAASRAKTIEKYFPAALWAFAALCAAILLWLHARPDLLETRLHYEARGLNVIVPALLGLVLLAVRTGFIMLDPRFLRRAFNVMLILGISQSAWHLMATNQWNGYLKIFRAELDSHEGLVPYEDSILKEPRIGRQSIANMNWGWTMPEMSIVLARGGNVKTIIDNRRGVEWQPFSATDPDALPDLSRYGIRYTRYVAALRSQEED